MKLQVTQENLNKALGMVARVANVPFYKEVFAKAKVTSHIGHTLGRAYVGVNRVVGEVKGQLVTEDGAPRLERIVPLALVAAAGVGLLVVGSRRRKR
jgi:hypothetical protein